MLFFDKTRLFILQHPLLKFLFFGNYFYGFCIVLLAIETYICFNLTIDYSLLILLALTVIAFYTHAYRYAHLGIQNPTQLNQFSYQRSLWYAQNYHWIKYLQWINFALIGILFFYYIYAIHLINISALDYFFFFSIVILLISYLGILGKNTRNLPLIKNGIIAWVWSASVVWLPTLSNHINLILLPNFLFHFIENFTFIFILSILFDVKDLKSDLVEGTSTIVTHLGLNKSLNWLVQPLSIGLLFLHFYFYLMHTNLGLALIIMTSLPYCLLFVCIQLIKKSPPLLFYLFVIDGLMLLKAIVGILAHFVLNNIN